MHKSKNTGFTFNYILAAQQTSSLLLLFLSVYIFETTQSLKVWLMRKSSQIRISPLPAQENIESKPLLQPVTNTSGNKTCRRQAEKWQDTSYPRLKRRYKHAVCAGCLQKKVQTMERNMHFQFQLNCTQSRYARQLRGVVPRKFLRPLNIE